MATGQVRDLARLHIFLPSPGLQLGYQRMRRLTRNNDCRSAVARR
jgi:hypothetical protein